MSLTSDVQPEPHEDDWELTGQACLLDADGNVDPSCEACQ